MEFKSIKLEVVDWLKIGTNVWFCAYGIERSCFIEGGKKLNNWRNYSFLKRTQTHGVYFFLWRCGPTRAMASTFLGLLDHTQRRTIVSRTPLDKWSARRRDLYPTTHNNYNRQTSMSPVGFEPKIPAGQRPQTNVLDCAATGTGPWSLLERFKLIVVLVCAQSTVNYSAKFSVWRAAIMTKSPLIFSVTPSK
jgi:hypothetical protein